MSEYMGTTSYRITEKCFEINVYYLQYVFKRSFLVYADTEGLCQVEDIMQLVFVQTLNTQKMLALKRETHDSNP